MFKHREKTKEFFKKNIAMLLAVVMLFGSFSSAGLAISSIFADDTGHMSTAEHKLAAKGDEGANFVNELVEITAEHVPYVWGGWQRDPYGPDGVDCRGFVRVGLRDTYGLNIFNTSGYVCDINGNAILKNGQKQWVDMAAYAPESAWKNYVGQYICVEGNGIKTYYQVLCAGQISEDKTTVNNIKFADGYSAANVYDITHPTTGRKYSSLLAWACQFPGTIIAHNGHYGVGIGMFDSVDDLYATYPGLNTWAASKENKNGDNVVLKDSSVKVVRYDESAYAYGNGYSSNNMKYYFGKTWYLNSSGTNVGIRADNWTSMGKADNDNELCVMLCLGSQKTTEVSFEKYDSNTSTLLNGAKYGIYKDSSCTGNALATFTTSAAGGVKVTLSRGTYYVKEISAPNGYSLSPTVTTVVVDGSKDTMTIKLYDNPVDATVLVRKVDAYNTSMALSGAEFVIQEKNSGTKVATLVYDANTQSYILPSGVELTYTVANAGKFVLKETKAPMGYINSGFTHEFDITKGNLTLTGANAVTNVANLQLKVQKCETGTTIPVAEARFSFTYNDANGVEKTIYATTDSSGIATFEAIPESDANYGTLKEISAPDGYNIPTVWKNGQLVALGKTEGLNASRDAFVTTIKVNNPKSTVTPEEPVVTSGSITIKKHNGSNVFDMLFNGGNYVQVLNDATYTIYTDSTLTNVAVNNAGKKMENLKSGADGQGIVVARDLPLGIYYVREVYAPNDFAVQPVTFVVNLLADSAVNGVLNYELETADLQQMVIINVEKTDADSKKPVEGAVYALRLTEDTPSIETKTLIIPKDVVLGYYVTDNNGKISINGLNMGDVTVDGQTFSPLTLHNYLVDSGYSADYQMALPNGIYTLEEVHAPEGYVLNETNIVIDATWENNSTEETVRSSRRENVTIGPAGMTIYADVNIKENRQTTTLEFVKNDATSGLNTASGWYGLADYYDTAVANGMAATLEGAVYQLINTTDIYDINTGDKIPAGTVLGVYETENNNGTIGFTVEKMNLGAYAGHKLPNGEYKFVEISPSKGYTINSDVSTASAMWDDSTATRTNIKAPTVFGNEEILMQAIEIKKVSTEDGSPIGGAHFEVYSVAKILQQSGLTLSELPWDTTTEKVNGYHQIDLVELSKIINDNNIISESDSNDNSTWYTNSDGVLTTGNFVYGDYIIVETEAPYGYEPKDAYYVRLPWVELSNENAEAGDGDVGGYSSLVHDMSSQPEAAFSITVGNDPIKINYTVLKVWEDNDDEFGLRPDKITAVLKADGVVIKTVELNADNGWTYTWTNLDKYQVDHSTEIAYTVDEENVPEYYTKTVVGGTITNECTYELPTRDITVIKTWDDENNRFNKRPESVQVRLFANGTEVSTVTLTADNATSDNEWSYTWKNMVTKYSPNGEEITYTVDEVETLEHYNKTVNGFNITNSCTFVPTIDFTVNKVWNDDNDAAKQRPESIKVQLYVDGVASGEAVELNDSNNWTYTWEKLVQYNGLDEIEYSVDEISVPDYYEKSVNGGTITNTYVPPELIDVTVNKVWDDDNDKYEKRPGSATVQLYADGQAVGGVITISESTGWTFTWKDLYKYQNKGLSDVEINYVVREVNIPEYYEEHVDRYTITNECTYVPTQVFISKYEVKDTTTTDRIPVVGAKLQLLDANGNVAVTYDGVKCEWTTNGIKDYVDSYGVPAYQIIGLRPGTYTLVEADAPDGYITAKPMTIVVAETEDTQYFTMSNKKTVVNVDKLDSVSGKSINGATLALLDSEKNPVKNTDGTTIEWVSNGHPHIINGLDFGTYYVREIGTPFGYQKADDVVFEVVDSDEPVNVTIENDRTYGMLTIDKRDADDHNKSLKDVELQLISVNTVTDPITGVVIYEKDEVVATLVTDGNGQASLNDKIDVFTYNEHGYGTAIKFKLIETKAPVGGQYDPDEISIEFEFEYVNDTTDTVTKHFVIDNKKPNIVVSKTGTPETFVGDYELRENVTVVEKDDELHYTITVENNGAGKAWNIVVKDTVPTNTEFISVESVHNAKFDITSNVVYWTIDELAAGAKTELKFVVKVTNDKACEIVNVAQYAMPEKKPVSNEDKLDPMTNNVWSNTNAVVHQVVEFNKTSTVLGGTDRTNATAVNVGDTIKYHLTFKSTNNVNNVCVSDAIPAGLTYVLGSAKINEVVDGDVYYNAETNTLTFSTINVNGEAKFEFEVTVDDIPVDSVVYYENIARAEYDVNGTERATLASSVVTHRTEKKFIVTKTGTPKTFEGEAENAVNVTVLKKDDVVEYTLTATNKGASDVFNAVIVDSVPIELKYIDNTTPDGVKVWANGDVITWVIPELKVGESVDVKFTASVVEQKAELIVNSAKYGTTSNVGEQAPTLGDDAKTTNDVVHQVVEFHKMSSVTGGKTLDDATTVSVGDTITYTLELITKHKLTNVTFADPIPEGLTFVEGSLMVKSDSDEDWKAIEEVVFDKESASFDAAFDIEPGKFYVRFDTVVDRIPVNTEKFYVNQATVEYDRFTGSEGENTRDSLVSEQVTHMTDVKVDGEKTGKVETFVGDYDEKHNVTVVEDGDNITYIITIKNTGLSDLNGIIIKDVVPEFTKFVSADNNGTYDEATNTVTWIVDKIKSGESANVQFVVNCTTNGEAHEIRNKASYAVPIDMNKINDDEWLWTDEVIHQTVAVSKDASIEHGVDEKDAKYVKIGTTFTYIIKYNSTNTTYNLSIQDVIPAGLKFVEGSAKYTLPNQETVTVEKMESGENGAIAFPIISEVPAGESVFVFDVTVEDVAEYDKEYTFVNKATAIVAENKDSENGIALETNTISNKTKKTETIDTPQLGLETTNPIVIWSIISIISAASAITLGIYGMSDRKKKE